ncbi:PQQ-binding-like beta-propeller repeat protein [Streptomyces sp. NPDC004065]|uniref:outer membrane protein assembly factor BamB family protein n=1 Tax=Streptomyces sp. NPDC004065 TaxID=3364689 RepID=UPI00384BE662
MSFGPPPSMFTESSVAADRAAARGRRRRLLGGALAAVLAAAVGVAALLSSAGDDSRPAGGSRAAAPAPDDIREPVEKRPASTAGRMAFRFSVDDLGPGESYDMPGMWATDKLFVKGINSSLAAFPVGKDAKPGQETWKLKFRGLICGTTRHVTADDRTAVLFRSSTDRHAVCDHVALVDLDNGTKLWEARYKTRSTGADGDPMGLTLTRSTVIVSWAQGSGAWDMDTGKQLWNREQTGDCFDAGNAGGDALLIRVDCWTKGTEGLSYRVLKVDPRSGRVLWTYKVADGVKDVGLLSAEPPVLATAAGDIGFTDLVSLGRDGRYRATIRLEGGHYLAKCADLGTYNGIDDCPGAVVGDGQVFLVSREDPDATIEDNSNWIIGFDLATGHTTKKFESGRSQLLYPLRMSGDRLLAFRSSADGIRPNGLVSLDPATGRETPYFYFGLPAEAQLLTDLNLADAVVRDGRLFFGLKRATGPEGKDKRWIWLALGVEAVKPGT